jgi:thiamine-phosphate diphosphorylase
MQCAELIRDAGSVLIVNDRVDLALGCGAAGVQLGGSSFPIAVARRLVGAERWIGASVHSVPEAAAAAAEGADFLLAGTLYATDSHPGFAGSGTGWLRSAGAVGLPVIGIGGITPSRISEVLEAGAYGVAVIRGIWAADRPLEALRDYLTLLE